MTLSPFKQAIVDAGFADNEFQLTLNYCLQDPAPRYPRSRMFAWPITLDRYEDRLTVCHALMMAEPFVMKVVATLRVPIGIEPDITGLNTPWHHAVDLATDSHFTDLIKTAHYTNPAAIMRAVVIGVMGGRLNTFNARQVIEMTVNEAHDAEPDDRSVSVLVRGGGMLRPAFVKPDNGKGRWAVNMYGRRNPVAELWAAIHGIEDGWFERDRQGYYNMSPAGLARHMGVSAPVTA